MRIAGLDCATTTGFAVIDGQSIHAGKFTAKGDSDGAIFGSFRLWLRGFLIAERIDHVAIEEPLRSDLTKTEVRFDGPNLGWGAQSRKIRKPITNMSTLRRLYGLAAIVNEVAHSLDIEVEEVNQVTWRKAFLGPVAPPKSCPDRTRWWKDQAQMQCRRIGLDLKSKDACDAVGVCFWLAGHLKQERLLAGTGDLFKVG